MTAKKLETEIPSPPIPFARQLLVAGILILVVGIIIIFAGKVIFGAVLSLFAAVLGLGSHIEEI